jgi:hypothetical protein
MIRSKRKINDGCESKRKRRVPSGKIPNFDVFWMDDRSEFRRPINQQSFHDRALARLSSGFSDFRVVALEVAKRGATKVLHHWRVSKKNSKEQKREG